MQFNVRWNIILEYFSLLLPIFYYIHSIKGKIKSIKNKRRNELNHIQATIPFFKNVFELK